MLLEKKRRKMDTPDVTVLLRNWAGGDQNALDQLTPVVYDELRRLAASYMRRERQDHTQIGRASCRERV